MRDEQKLRFSSLDHWQVNFMREGRSWVGTERTLAESQPGNVEFRSLTIPFAGRRIATKMTSLYLPSDMFSDIGGLPMGCNNIVLSSNIATLFFDYIVGLETRLNQLTARDLPRIVEQIQQFVLDCLEPYIKDDRPNNQSSQIGLIGKARKFINSNLAREDLTADLLSQHLAISRTKLYQLFEPYGGVLSYIRKRRLAAAYRALSDPTNHSRVAEIALASGFDSAANFSRAFTQEYGHSPRSVRLERPEILGNAIRKSEGGSEPSFGKLLLALGTN